MILTEIIAAADTSLFGYFLESNTAGKIIILILGFSSVLAWTAMATKSINLNQIHSTNKRFEKSLNQQGQALIDLDLTTLQTRKNPYATLVLAAIQAFYRWDGNSESEQAKRKGQIENALQRVLSLKTQEYEKWMIILASIVTVAPFLGLLGTVWGVMDSFGGVASAGSATLKSLAPGVSGALLTTVAGLVVALPSVAGYNYLLSKIRTMTVELENFASSVADRLELESR